ncbi:MAG: CdaR family protein [Ruminococcus sp.]|nr:CdaR family protein [Ruminococcus sp.]
MEEVKNENSAPAKNKRNLKGDFGLRILALAVAIIAWFVLSITQYPTITKTISGVHVDFNMEGTKAQEKGLDALNYKDITVDVEIQGMNYEIGGYTANDLSATVDLGEVTKEGTYTLDINVKSTHSTDKCTIVSVTPETIQVDFDRITTKTLELTAEAPLVSAEEGYTLREATVTPSEITVEGAKNDLDNISKVTAQITKSRKISEDVTISTEDLVFYDADDNILDSSKFTVQNSGSYDVSFVVYKKKTADLRVDVSGCPDNFDINTLPMILSEESISVISPNLEDGDTEEITVGTIPLSSINLSKNFSFSIPLNTGEINMTGSDNVVVSFDDEGYTSKEFTVDASRIKTVNRPAGMTTTIETKKLTNVVIYGPEEVISKLEDSDIYAQVDLSDIYEYGSYTRNALIYVPDHDDVWCFGVNPVQVVTANSADSTSDNE